MSLNERQKRFCEYYIANGGNASKAARDAGYSLRTADRMGYENLNKPEIKEYIKAFTADDDNKRICSAKEVLEYLSSVIRREQKEYVVAQEKTEERIRDENGNWKTIKKEKPILVEIPAKLSDSNKAAELLGRNLMLWDGSGKEGKSSEVLAALLDEMRRRNG